MSGITYRVAKVTDAEALLEIYAPYVLDTAITFEYEVPTKEEFARRIETTLKKYPYIVALSQDDNGKEEIVGYSYTSAFKERAAYDWAVETTIYVKEGLDKKGIGKGLYNVLEKLSAAQNIINMNACIGYPEVEDEHLTKNSAQFHEHLGYTLVGEFHKCGYKFGRWYNMIWMEKMIGKHVAKPDDIIPFSELESEKIEELLK